MCFKMEDILSVHKILNIIIKTVNKSPTILSDRYLEKDVSVISKWKRNKFLPKQNDISKIVDFAVEESTFTQREFMRDQIELLISQADIRKDIKVQILNIESFKEFLLEALNLSSAISARKATVGRGMENFLNRFDEETKQDMGLKGDFQNIDSSDMGSESDNDDPLRGFMQFDLHLFNKTKQMKFKGKSDIMMDQKGTFTAQVHKKEAKSILKEKSILGLILIGVISSFLVVQFANSSQGPSSIEGMKLKMEKKTNAAVQGLTQTSKPQYTPRDKKASIPDNTPAPTQGSVTEEKKVYAKEKDVEKGIAEKGAKTNAQSKNKTGDGEVKLYDSGKGLNIEVNGNNNFVNTGSNFVITIEK
ncbi:MAG: hypothetical protein N2645_17845 [Clostridia bacterium]|nr:hypothetical protein [Clostridia bacterium]